MEGHCSAGQSPQWAVVPMEEEEDDEVVVVIVVVVVVFLISNFRCVLNVVFFRVGDSPVSEFYVPTFRNTLFHLHKC